MFSLVKSAVLPAIRASYDALIPLLIWGRLNESRIALLKNCGTTDIDDTRSIKKNLTYKY